MGAILSRPNSLIQREYSHHARLNLGKKDQKGTGKGSYRYIIGTVGSWGLRAVSGGDRGSVGENSVYFVTRDSFTKYTRQSRHRLGTSPPSHSPLHILLVVSLSLLIQTGCAHTRHQDRGSVLIEKGRRRGRPAESLPAEPPCLANALLLSPPRSIVGTLSPAPNRRTAGKSGRSSGGKRHGIFFLEYTT